MKETDYCRELSLDIKFAEVIPGQKDRKAHTKGTDNAANTMSSHCNNYM